MKGFAKALVVSAALALGLAAKAQEFPARTVTIIGSSAPGAMTDVLARSVGERLSRKWGQPVVIEARPGAAYAVAASAVMRAAPDGYTLIASELGMFTFQHFLYQPGERPFDGQTDFVPISGMAAIPAALIVNPSVPAKTLAELVKLAKEKPGSITYGTGGPGTFPHLGVLMLERLAGVKFLAVHYRGVAPALNDVTAGHVNMIVIGPSLALPAYQAGKLSILGVGSREPIAQLTNVPPIASVAPGYSATVGFGLAAPKGTPKPVVDRINADVQEILQDKEFQAKVLEPQLLRPMLGDAAQFAAALRADSELWQKIISETGVSLKP
jgi:tripartite-type tricarboxylate transporter receptor subunit TctC